MVPYDQPHWTWVLSDPPPSGLEKRELTAAYGRHITYRLDGVCDAQFSLNGRHDEATAIAELATDLIGYRRNLAGTNEKLYRGRIITQIDEISPDGHYCQFSTNDYRGLLGNRIIGAAGKSFAAVDVGTIAWTLISDSQALTNGNWAITNGAGTTSGVVHTIAYDPGAVVEELINNLAHRASGAFEWEIDAALALNRYYPTRGSATGALLDYGGVVTHCHKDLGSTSFGNFTLLSGDATMGVVPATASSATIGTDAMGRWERFVGFPDIKEQTTLDQRALWAIDTMKTLRPEWALTIAPGRWDRSTMWLGDTIRFIARSGRIVINALHRIVEISVSIDEDGFESIILGVVLA